jgi:hypothetical protein
VRRVRRVLGVDVQVVWSVVTETDQREDELQDDHAAAQESAGEEERGHGGGETGRRRSTRPV